jgi:hypothetical protein
MDITMGVPSVVPFEVEMIELDLEYEWRYAMRRLEKLKRPSKGKSLKAI